MDDVKIILTKTNNEYVVFIVRNDGKVEITMEIEKYAKSNTPIIYMEYEDFKYKYLNKHVIKKDSLFVPFHAYSLFRENKCILTSRTQIGAKNSTNEDSVEVATHHSNKNMKLLTVADGIHNLSRADLSSSLAVKTIKNWFESLDSKCDRDEVLNGLEKIVDKINNTLINYSNFSKMGTTLSAAVVIDNDTVYSNIGDSRIYLLRNNKLIQVTEDSYKTIGNYYKKEIAVYLGMEDSLDNIDYGYISNKDYDGLLLLTDGVTDYLTNEKMEKIIKTTNKNLVLDRLIHTAFDIDQHNGLTPGEDNATGAIYLK